MSDVEPYRIEDGVLVETGEGLNPQTRIARETVETERWGAPELRTGPTPEGYALPDTQTITTRRKATS